MTKPVGPKKSINQPDLHKEMRGLGVLVEKVDDKVSLIAEQYGDIKETLDAHSESIARVTVNSEIIKTDVEFIKHNLKRKIDIDEFAALERRVAMLEKRR